MAHLPPFSSFGTLAIHAGQDPENFPGNAVVAPISMSVTFKQEAPGVYKEFEYSRSGNPTRKALEEQFAAIASGKHALVWASGLAGTMGILQMLLPGDHVVAMNDLYGGTNRMFRRIATPQGLLFDFVDATNPAKVEAAMRPNTKLVWIETPTNPLLQICDIRAIAAIVRRFPNAMLVVDNTFMSSYFQRPLELGAHIEFASVTKYYNGHSDVVMGVTITRDDKIGEKLRFLQFAAGYVPSPFDCFLVNRGLKTLHLRMRQHQVNAFAVATFLQASPKVVGVLFPGLPTHPNHLVAKTQSTGFSGMISFRIRGGVDEAARFLKACKVFTLGESLGAVESLCEHPAIMTHASISKDERERLGITDNFIRLSCGVEETIDLLEDLDQALKAAVPAGTNPSPADFVHAYQKTLGGDASAVAPVPTTSAIPAAAAAAAATTTAATAPSTPANPYARGRVPAGTMPHPAARFENPPPPPTDEASGQRGKNPPGGKGNFVFG
eukprot:m.224207 g.224207  ORF g.224207 m.224207 type:complete len:496 (+) comp16420_c0_seq1:17-1504(+)